MSDGTEMIVPIIALGTLGAIVGGGRKKTVTTKTRKGKKTTTTTYTRGGLFGNL